MDPQPVQPESQRLSVHHGIRSGTMLVSLSDEEAVLEGCETASSSSLKHQ